MDHQHFRLPSSGDLVGDYRIVDLIGNGGQGHVYRAEASGRAYAVKFLDPGLDRFGTREVQALMTLTELRLPGAAGGQTVSAASSTSSWSTWRG